VGGPAELGEFDGAVLLLLSGEFPPDTSGLFPLLGMSGAAVMVWDGRMYVSAVEISGVDGAGEISGVAGTI